MNRSIKRTPILIAVPSLVVLILVIVVSVLTIVPSTSWGARGSGGTNDEGLPPPPANIDPERGKGYKNRDEKVAHSDHQEKTPTSDGGINDEGVPSAPVNVNPEKGKGYADKEGNPTEELPPHVNPTAVPGSEAPSPEPPPSQAPSSQPDLVPE